MNYRYLRISESSAWGKHTITREYLAGVKAAGDLLLDLVDMTYFDGEENAWKPIEGDES